MARVLILFAHPGQRHSRLNVRMAREAAQLDGVTFVDLYAEYPRFNIDIDAEQARLVAHDVILFQFPIYWYSVPALLKEWQDLVLEYGFAYGQSGSKLAGKLFLPVVTTGGARDAYREEGSNHFRLRTLLSPLEQTALLCGMRFLPPAVLFSAHDSAADGRAETHIAAYLRLLAALRDETLDLEAVSKVELLDDDALSLIVAPGEPRPTRPVPPVGPSSARISG
ncbi:Kef-type potassium/proton antiporter accessory protein (CPA2 family) [Rhizobium sp. PP-F2F-G48]|uniref:NAD(P)H-dependent oxidoreductase n=1 Tax=Rhizobium sp. PP-F2F-G48 TaxID=2135651 RepID=UPI00104577A1|nr:NAD(P)H-dependent oxidoreductase [Rhizobium sp. PP-F2F-G48]TCM58142.1 Kef-type potassium/proton antiporter accessory protein (CPA2 family) [Rhizobium sp. PP-F2F-G48]